jgi:tetratricopeptide (TPR) repeat protein
VVAAAVIDRQVVDDLLAGQVPPLDVLERADALDVASVEALLQRATELARSQPDEALRLLAAVRTVAGVAGAHSVRPAADYLLARLTLETGEPLAALELIDAAESGFAALGMLDDARRTLLGRMHALDDLGRHEEAVTVGRSLLLRLDEPRQGDRPDPDRDDDRLGLRAAALGNLGVALGFTGHHEEALDAYRQTEALWRSVGAEHEAAAAVANQGIELLAVGSWAEALSRLGTAAELFAEVGDRFWLAKCLGHRGEALTGAGRFVEALADYERARGELAELGAKTESWRLTLQTADTLLLLGLVQEARSLAAEVEPELAAAGLRHDLATARWLTGLADLLAGNRSRARAALAHSVELYREVGDTPGEIKASLDLARCLDEVAAATLVRQAASVADPGRWPGLHCLTLLALADQPGEPDDPGPSDSGDPDGPRRPAPLLLQAQELADSLAIPQLQLVTRQHRGMRLLAAGRIEEAVACFEQALSLVDRGGAGIRDATLHAAYRRSRHAAQDGLIRCLLLRNGDADVERAFALIDDVKGHSLTEQLKGRLHPRIGAPTAQAQLATMELNAAYSHLFVGERHELQRLRDRIGRLEHSITAMEARAPAQGRRTARADLHAPPLSTSTLCYYVLGEEVLAFHSSAGQITLRRSICTVATVTDLLDGLQAHLGGHAVEVIARLGSARAAACQRLLQQLYLAVLAPVADLLPPVTDRSAPLLIVPHGPLHRIPFHALHDGCDYLLAERAVSVTPSLALAQRAALRGRRGGGRLVVGVADSDASLIEREAVEVAAVAPDSTLLLAAVATVERFRHELGRAGLVHLACHGLFRPGNPTFSSLRLADRWIRAADLADLDLDGAVIVLSACESGTVETPQGGEATGLAGSLLAAGACCVIVSQWLADDRVTKALMVRLHVELAGGAHPVEALRRAQLAIMPEHPHPFHWAPFIAVGAPLPQEERHGQIW